MTKAWTRQDICVRNTRHRGFEAAKAGFPGNGNKTGWPRNEAGLKRELPGCTGWWWGSTAGHGSSKVLFLEL